MVEIMVHDQSLLILLSWIFKVTCAGNQRVLGFSMKANTDVLGLILAGRLAAYTWSFPFPSFAGADIKRGDESGK